MNIIEDKPVISFYEDGDWLRIETVGRKPRYLRKQIAVRLLQKIGQLSEAEKNDLLIIR